LKGQKTGCCGRESAQQPSCPRAARRAGLILRILRPVGLRGVARIFIFLDD